jgi:Reverse transcriptase (RNA-dependent DNA polymerase)
VDISYALDDQLLHDTFMITPDVDEVILGQSFLKNHETSWCFNSNIILVNKIAHTLHFNDTQVTCRRIVIADDIIVPPLSSTMVPTHSPIRTWSIKSDDCLLNTTEPVNGLFVARSLLPPTDVNVPITVCNTRNTSLKLEKGTIIGMTEMAERTDDSITTATRSTYSNDRQIAVHNLIEDIINKLPADIARDNSQRMRNILWKYSDCLSINDFDLGYTDLVEHTIDTGSATPIRQTLRRQPVAYQRQIDEHVQQMLQTGVIVPSTSQWSSNVCLVKKKNGQLRFAVDYRHINAITTIPAYPMPRVDACLDSLGNSTWYSTMDLRAAFWQVKQAEQDAPKTAFITRTGYYQFTRLPFGLSGSPGLFQRLADLIFSGLTWDALLVFLDDIIIFGRTIDEHFNRIEQVFQRLAMANLKITPAKCHFFSKKK